MKKITLFLFLLVFGATAMTAQIKEGSASMSQGSNNAFTIELRKTEAKEVEKAWIKYLKDFDGKVKKAKKSPEVFADNSEIKAMSSNTVDIYSTAKQSGENTTLTVWFDLGGAYLNSSMHGDKVAVAEKILNEFALSVSRASIEEDLKEQEKILKKLNGDMKDLKKDKEDYEDEIAKCEKKIAEAKEGIKENAGAQETKTKEIEAQAEVVEKIKKLLKKLD